MYKISKFENFSINRSSNSEDIKDIFQDLIDKWNMVNIPIGSRKFTGDIFYQFIMGDSIFAYKQVVDIGKYIKNIEDVYLMIDCSLAGLERELLTGDLKTLHEFNGDCENLLKRFQSEFNCELLTAYGNQYLQSKGIQDTRFVFVFRN